MIRLAAIHDCPVFWNLLRADVDRARQRRGAEAVDGHRRDRVGEARGQRRPARDIAHTLVRDVHAAGLDVLDPVEVDPDLFARPHHRLTEQVIDPHVRQRAAVTPYRRSRAAEYVGISHLCSSPRLGV
jgi:hypothetical protein